MRKVTRFGLVLLVNLLFGLVLLVNLLPASDEKGLPSSVQSAAKPENGVALPKAGSERANLKMQMWQNEFDNLMDAWTWEEGKRNPDPAKFEAIHRRLNELLEKAKEQEKKDK